MKITCCMQAGHGQPFSQDRILVHDSILANGEFSWTLESNEPGCYAIFDGVGGLSGGAYASSYAAEMMSKYFMQNSTLPLASYISNISSHLKRSNGCATTASGIVCIDSRYYLFHTGNTRLWLSDGKYLQQLTVDQTFVEENSGRLSNDEYERSSHIITGYLGGPSSDQDKLIIDDITDKLDSSSKILATCDGIHDYLDVFDLETILNRDGELREFISQARQNGSNDDCSILLIERNR